MDLARTVAAQIATAERMIVLTGAGISTAAGIPDFRGPDGIYVTRRYSADIFDIEAFDADPRAFFVFARDFLTAAGRMQPTRTHRFLARLEEQGRLQAVITQNIDGLHQRAGSRRVIELHGSFTISHCRRCGRAFTLAEARTLVLHMDVPRCGDCQGVIKPDVVFFGELVLGLDQAQALARACDLLLVVGSSLTVYPAAALPSLARGRVIVVNRGPIGIVRPVLQVDDDCESFFDAVAALLMPQA
ncbi:MAG: Sir2 family NAD-dependent protein deacetylase [Vicinamibacteria bacterium]|jgi:NAD-dependent deacetylase|nr:Sir2 family NAD-dependent protein deacetylase [Vicinamibacteria bacterium]